MAVSFIVSSNILVISVFFIHSGNINLRFTFYFLVKRYMMAKYFFMVNFQRGAFPDKTHFLVHSRVVD